MITPLPPILPPELKPLPRTSAPAIDRSILRSAFGILRDLAGVETWPQIRDISYAQSGFNGPGLAARGVGLMIRMGQGIWLDSDFWDNYHEALASGVKFGIYWFFQPNMDYGPQVAAFLAIYNSLPWKPRVIALDVEDINTGSVIILPKSVAWHTHNVLSWLQAIELATGYTPGIYTRKNYWDLWTYRMAEWSHYWLWVASWTQYSTYIAMPADWSAWKLWQYEGGTGRDPDIPGPVDLNNFNGTQAEQDLFFGEGEIMPTEPFEPYVVIPDKSKCVYLAACTAPTAGAPQVYWWTAAREERITILEVSANNWGRCDQGWVSLFYTVKIEEAPLDWAHALTAWAERQPDPYTGPQPG